MADILDAAGPRAEKDRVLSVYMLDTDPGTITMTANTRFSTALLLTSGAALLLPGYGHGSGPQSMEVTASAYTLRAAETKDYAPGIAAWGDKLEPGMKAIAVSRDLIDEGLGHMTEVKIEGLEGTWIVRDKMNKRWEQKIDIFMGRDVERAREWGKRTVTIHWTNPPQE